YCKLAQSWGCVLLLDKVTDVFLAERDSKRLKRNALVSVFLRLLEYYAGLLILTTNRARTFDEAFRSRIHISLYYPWLDQDTIAKIWKISLRRVIEVTDLDIYSDDKGVKQLYKKH
ncbi:hypothetical protein T440DRAFT_407597, partial [Plenodomus tracheiphilus IPT5]